MISKVKNINRLGSDQQVGITPAQFLHEDRLAAIYQTAQTINRLDRLKNLKLQQIHFKPDKTFTIEHYLEGRTKRIFKPLLT